MQVLQTYLLSWRVQLAAHVATALAAPSADGLMSLDETQLEPLAVGEFCPL